MVDTVKVLPAVQAVQTRLTATVHVEAKVPAAQVLQTVHEAAFELVLKVLPATHDVQTVSAEAMQVADLYVPAAQTEQALQLATFADAENVLPAVQAAQTRFTVKVHCVV